MSLRRAVWISVYMSAARSAEWKRCRVGLDYHVEIAKHFYSVPFTLARQEVEARITSLLAGDMDLPQRRLQPANPVLVV